MPVEVILPVLGETMDEGTIVTWLADVGQRVQKGEPLYQVETDKAVLDVEAPASGILRKVFYQAGQKVPVLAVVGLIAAADEDLEGYEVSEGQGVAAPATKTPSAAPVQPAARERVFASPRARKAAAAHGVDLASVRGTGPGGRIVEQDVLDFVESRPSATPAARKRALSAGVDLVDVQGTGPSGRVTRADVEAMLATAAPPQRERLSTVEQAVPFTGVRRVIAERMSQSALTTARVTLTTEVNATELVKLRTTLKEELSELLGFAISYTDILVAVAARALQQYKYMNARLREDEIELLPQVNIGVAADTERGLLVPVIRHVGDKSISEIAQERRVLVTRAREGKSTPDDLSGGTFTITNLGVYGVDAFTPIINLPECAILGIGRIREMPAVVDGQISVEHSLWLSLTFDHRLVDGAPAARFLQRIRELVEQPYLLLV
jgi:pyruvate dehydrogenase E2 component (dihydrolipoamide acetyltransferase)